MPDMPVPPALSALESEPGFRTRLSSLIASEEAMGIYYGEEGLALLANGEAAGKCTNCAWWVIETLGEGSVYGYNVETNPVACSALQDWVGGHDFAVIRGRYIVDPWLGVFAGHVEEGRIFDLRDPADAAAIRHFYGDPARWDWYDPDSRTQIEASSVDYPAGKRLCLSGQQDAPAPAASRERSRGGPSI